jgi:type IV pilus assembly protein PilW
MSRSKTYSTHQPCRGRTRGLTLVELMIAMLISVVLMLGSVTMFAQSRTNYRINDTVARLQENARFAITTMEPDIRLAKFWGLNGEPAFISVPGPIAVTCPGGIDATAWSIQNLGQEVGAADDNYAAGTPVNPVPCPPNSVARASSDVLVLRHASGQVTPATPGTIQVRADLMQGQLFNAAVPAGFGPEAQTHDVVINIYYVDDGSNLDDTLPSLRRKTLVNGGILQDEEIIAGVENLQIQYGVDTDGDGAVERYVDSNHVIVTPGAIGFLPGAEIIAIRLWMLMRSNQYENGYVDAGPYVRPDANLPAIVPAGRLPVAGNYPQPYRRLQISKTVFLRNNRI